LDGIHRSGGSEAERWAHSRPEAQLIELHRIQSSLADLEILSGRQRSDEDDDTSNSAGSIFFQLYEASCMRKRILEVKTASIHSYNS
jgi:hypothetical protein